MLAPQLFKRFIVGRTGGVGVASKLHEAAQRQGAHLPDRAQPVGAGEQGRPKAHGEGVRMHAAHPSGPVMTELMDDHDEAHHKDEGEDGQGS